MRICSICNKELPIENFYYKSWYCKPCHKKKNNDWRIEKWGSLKNYELLHKYGISEVDYLAKIDEQNGLCAICKDSDTKLWETDRGRFVDHDHLTGQVRGILCIRCN